MKHANQIAGPAPFEILTLTKTYVKSAIFNFNLHIMQPINTDNYTLFTEALNQNQYISCKNGQWKTDGCIVRFIRWLFGWETNRLQNIITTFNQVLDQQESIPIYFRVDQIITAQNLVTLAQTIENYTRHDAKCSRGLNEMKLKIISLKYRMQISMPQDDPNEELKEQFKQLVVNWKQHDPLFHDATLHPADLRKIDEFCRFPEFAQHLINHPRQAYHQFKIAIRDNVDVEALIEFNHHISRILYDCHMTCRIGAFAQPLLKVWNLERKKLELLVEGNPVDILDPNRVVRFTDGFEATIGDIFRSYRHLNTQPTSGEYEFFKDGLRRWNGHHWGPKKVGAEGYHSIDVSKPRFWEKPDFPVYDTVSKEHIERKYNIHIRDSKSSIQVLEATRSNRGIGLEGHGYTLFYVPRNDGTYRVIPVGLYANLFPVNYFQNASFIADTVPGTIVFPDPNYTYTRQKASIAKEISDAQLELQMRRIAATRLNGGWFMWSWENCCHYAKNLFMNIIEDDVALRNIIKKRTFKIPFIDCRPNQWFITAIQKGYRVCQIPYIKTVYEELIFLILGTWRELTVKQTTISENRDVTRVIKKSSYESKFGQSKTNNLPAVFHQHVERNEIPGAVLSYGHGRFA